LTYKYITCSTDVDLITTLSQATLRSVLNQGWEKSSEYSELQTSYMYRKGGDYSRDRRPVALFPGS